MPPLIALILWLVLLLALLRFDPARDQGVSFAVWIPVIWMFIVGSRLPSQWLGVQVGSFAEAAESGNSLDRTVFSVLILASVLVLMSRSFNWLGFFSRNLFLLAFLSFGLASIFWSDFPFVALKRWFRDFGNYLVILVPLTEANALGAIRALIRRSCYLLIPLSILLIKYFPALARQYESYSGTVSFVGAATSKNMLGTVCLIGGIFFFWDLVTRWPERKERRARRIVALDLAFFAMTLWLLNLSKSATSQVCLALGCLVIGAAHLRMVKRNPMLIKVLVPVGFFLFLILVFGFEMTGKVAQQLGRDPTLTDRTVIWNAVLSVHTNPFLGTGYESFWIGSRILQVWQVRYGINEAHNGYIDVYLNLGGIGLVLLSGFLFAGYRRICQKFTESYALGVLGLATWAVILFYNMTEAAFKGGLLWLMLLLCATAIPIRAEAAALERSRSRTGLTPDRFSKEIAVQRR